MPLRLLQARISARMTWIRKQHGKLSSETVNNT